MDIDALLHQAAQANSNTAIRIPEDWSQGRTAFGGLSVAMIYVAMQQAVDSDRVLRSLNVQFVGPIVLDADAWIETRILRAGGHVTQVQGQIVQDGKPAISVQAAFGKNRVSKLQVEPNLQHHMPLPAKAKFIPQIPKVTPKFMRHVDYFIADGKLPYTGSSTSSISGWMRFKQAPARITDGHLITLIDAWPPTLLQMLRIPKPASSLSWVLEFIHPHREIEPHDWFAYQAITRQAADGYAHTEANIWDSHGELVALSRQVVTIFG